MALLRRAGHRIGRRGLLLIAYALLYASRGIKALVDPGVDGGRFLLYFQLPPELRAVIWLVPAILAIVAALYGRRRNDAFGWAAVALPAALVFVSYLSSSVVNMLGIIDYDNSWLNASVWGFVLLIVLTLSGWKEDDTPRPEKER